MKSLIQWIREKTFSPLTQEQKAYKAWDELSDYFTWTQATGSFSTIGMMSQVENAWSLLTKEYQRRILGDLLETVSLFEMPWYCFGRFEKKFYEQYGEWPFGKEFPRDL